MSRSTTPRPPGHMPVPLRRGLRILAGAVTRWFDDDCGQRAAAIAYYALLSFFPFLILLGSGASLMFGGDAEEIRRALHPLRPMLPRLQEGFWDRVQDLVDARGVLSLFSLLLLVFLATRVTVAIQRAFRPIFRQAEHPPRSRHPWVRGILAHVMTIAVLVAIGLMLTSVTLLEIFVHSESSPRWMDEALGSSFFSRHALPTAVLSVLAYALLVVLPDVKIERRCQVIGAIFFAVTHDAVVTVWARATGTLASSDVFYGSFIGVVSFATWTWVAASLLLLAATLVAELNATPPLPPDPLP